jgi:16S rRNA A1518/A1519 N6-dimethyltransferase RsmA/KsgA/DIM1 with predicted DNA glycosylase/AP lyase activity
LIIRKLVQLEPAPAQAILLMQREVGERLLAKPPQGQLIGLAVQLWGMAERLMKVPPHAFGIEPNAPDTTPARKFAGK